MKLVLGAALIALPWVTFNAFARDEAKTDRDWAQGEWMIMSWESKALTLDKDQLQKSRMIIAGDEWQPIINGRKVEKMTVSLNRNTAPKEVDFQLSPTQVMKGIYKGEKDSLIICRTTIAGDPRPSSFKAGENCTFIILRRVPKE